MGADTRFHVFFSGISGEHISFTCYTREKHVFVFTWKNTLEKRIEFLWFSSRENPHQNNMWYLRGYFHVKTRHQKFTCNSCEFFHVNILTREARDIHMYIFSWNITPDKHVEFTCLFSRGNNTPEITWISCEFFHVNILTRKTRAIHEFIFLRNKTPEKRMAFTCYFSRENTHQ